MEYIIIGLIILAIYLLFVRGYLWKIIVFIFGWAGLHSFLSSNYEFGNTTFMTILGFNISWAIIIPTIILILAAATTKMKE